MVTKTSDPAMSSKSKSILLGIIVGLSVGIIVSVFRFMITYILQWVIEMYDLMRTDPIWIIAWIVFSLIITGILGYLIKGDPHIKGSGIPQVELQLQGKLQIEWWSVLWRKFIGGMISIGSGLMLGREGPSIQLGASIGHGVASVFKRHRLEQHILISSGAGAGLAAAFNAPIAGVMFVLEEIHHNFSPVIAMTTLTAALISNFVSLRFFGLKPALDLGNTVLFPDTYYGYVILLGVLLAFFGYLYQKMTFALSTIYQTLFPIIPTHYYCGIAFLFIIPVGIFNPSLLGGGGELVLELVKHQPSVLLLSQIFIIRFVFSMMSYGTGLPGGIFLPILSLGAILGAIFGEIVIGLELVPEELLVCFIYFAMAGYFGAIGRAPLTALLLVTEMVGGLNQLMPLGICVFSAYLTSEILKMPPIYEALAEKLAHHNNRQMVGKRTAFEWPIMVDSPLIHHKIKDISWPENILVLAIRRGAKEIVVNGKTEILTGDNLIILTDEGLLSESRDLLRVLEETMLL